MIGVVRATMARNTTTPHQLNARIRTALVRHSRENTHWALKSVGAIKIYESERREIRERITEEFYSEHIRQKMDVSNFVHNTATAI